MINDEQNLNYLNLHLKSEAWKGNKAWVTNDMAQAKS
jgi:hypothetical protein